MKKSILFALPLFILISLGSCTSKNETNILYVKETIKKEDVTKSWLRDVVNYKKDKKKYLSVLYRYYDKLIANKKIDQAAEVLDLGCMYLADSYDFNDKYVSVIKEFDFKYREKLPALKTTFIDSYIANFYFDKYDLKKAEENLKKVTVLKPNDYSSCYNVGRAYYDLSYVYYITGKQKLSLEANKKSFEYFSQIDNAKGLAFAYSNYANIYTALGDKKSAIENADKAIKAYKKINNTYNVYIGLINKISIYEFLKDNRKEALIDSVYQIFQKSKDENDILKIKIYNFKAENLINQNKLTEAKEMLAKSKLAVDKINSADLTTEYNVSKALYEIKKNPNYSNFEDLKKTLPTLITNQQYEKVNMFYGVLQNSALQNSDFKSAYTIEKDKQIIADSIGNIIERVNIAELETRYETEKKEQQIILQQRTILNKNTTIALLASLFIGLILTAVIYISKQKQIKLELEKQHAQLYTKQLLEKTEEERKRIASDLHDSVSHELLSLKNLFEDKAESTNNKIDAIINDIRIISRNLHPIMFDKVGLKSSIEQLVERAQLVNQFMVTAEINYMNSLTSADELQIYRIIQEALSNVIKYANALAAKITINETGNHIVIEVKDNGKGFDFKKTLANRDAFGLHNIIERSRAIGGKAKITADVAGTVISIVIKK